jgi:serralysin
VDGGDGVDTVSYVRDSWGYDLVVDLATGVNGGVAADDVLIDIENLQGSYGNDELRGDDEANTLDGEHGDDILIGRGGDDILIGGYGIDVLSGGAGADSFVFFEGYSGPGTGIGTDADRILDFTTGEDVIDLSSVDADVVTGGNQAFCWVGNAAFSCAAGELRYGFDGVDTRIQGDLDGDGAADFEIVLAGALTPVGGDFFP